MADPTPKEITLQIADRLFGDIHPPPHDMDFIYDKLTAAVNAEEERCAGLEPQGPPLDSEEREEAYQQGWSDYAAAIREGEE